MSIKIESTTDSAEQVAHTMGNAKMPGKPVDPAARVENPSSSKIVPDTATVGPKSAASKPDEDPEDIEPDEDDVTPSVQADGTEKPTTGTPEKKKGGFQKKIDKMTKTQRQLEAERDALKAERDSWKEQFMTGRNAAPEKPAPQEQVASAKPLVEPKPDQFKTNAEYIKALTDYKFEAYKADDINKQNVEKMKSERDKMISDHNSRVQEYAKQVPDFSDVLHEVDDIPFTPALADVLLGHERGPELMYALAKDPGNYERISKLPIRAIEREIGKLEAKLETSSAVETVKQPTEKTTTTAPRPIKTVSASTPPGKKLGWYEGMPLSEYREWRKSQGAR